MKEVIFNLPDDVLSLIIHKVENTPQEASLLEKWIYDGEGRKTGKWVNDRYCSNCEWSNEDVYYTASWTGRYCPNCGEKMKVDE